MRLAVPAYFGPWETTHWATLLAHRPHVVVINPDTGPGVTRHSGYRSLVRQMRRCGTTVLGYVPTGWGARPLASCRGDADRYLSAYGTSGVFFDEIEVDRRALAHLRALGAGYEHVGFNPGRAIPREFRQAFPGAFWVTFEGTARCYLERSPVLDESDHSTDCHLIHSVSRSQRPRVEQALGHHRPGFAYVTADHMPNPWDVFDPPRVGGLPGVSKNTTQP